MQDTALVLLNPAARGGRGRALWKRVADKVAARHRVRTVELDPEGRWQEDVRAAVAAGARLFVAAGGDGTLNAVLNALARARGAVPWERFTLGAVGLGSSNDFHKPVRLQVEGIPLRIDSEAAAPRDVGLARWLTVEGDARSRHFLVSASVGITAEANCFFNAGDGVQAWLNARFTPAAILHAALRTILVFRNIAAAVDLPGTTIECEITNLSVMKTQHLSGTFRFDVPVAPDDGLFAVNLCEGMGRGRVLRTLIDLARGRFLGRSGRRHWRAARVAVRPVRPLHVELDGEVFQAREAHFAVLPDRIGVCR